MLYTGWSPDLIAQLNELNYAFPLTHKLFSIGNEKSLAKILGLKPVTGESPAPHYLFRDRKR